MYLKRLFLNIGLSGETETENKAMCFDIGLVEGWHHQIFPLVPFSVLS